MSESLWIMRHGEAAPGFPDAQRELTAPGHDEVSRMARWLRETLQAEDFDKLRIAASPYRRALQTAAIMAEQLGKQVEPLSIMTPDDPVEPVIEWLQQHAQATPWLLVSHMPLVGALCGRLVEGEHRSTLPMPTAAIAGLEADIWAAGCARLKAFTTPADSI